MGTKIFWQLFITRNFILNWTIKFKFLQICSKAGNLVKQNFYDFDAVFINFIG